MLPRTLATESLLPLQHFEILSVLKNVGNNDDRPHAGCLEGSCVGKLNGWVTIEAVVTVAEATV